MEKLLMGFRGRKIFIGTSVVVAALMFVGYQFAFATTNTMSLDLEKDSAQFATFADQSSFPTGDVTVEAWVKFESLVDNTQILHKGDFLNDATLVLFIFNNQLRGLLCETQDCNGPYALSIGSTTDFSPNSEKIGKWTHVAMTWEAGSSNAIKLYVDGVEESYSTQITGAASINDSSSIGRIGQSAYNGNHSDYFDGKIDDVRVWSVVRTPSEINSNKNSELVGNETGLVYYWKLNGDGSDATANANDLTLMGGASFVDDHAPASFPRSAVRKFVDETVASDVILQDDDELKNITLEANQTYVVHGVFFASSTSNAPDIKIALVPPLGSTMMIGFNSGSEVGQTTVTGLLRVVGAASQRIPISNNGVTVIQVNGTIVTGSTAGTLKLEWAQNTANANGTAVLQGSYLKADPL